MIAETKRKLAAAEAEKRKKLESELNTGLLSFCFVGMSASLFELCEKSVSMQPWMKSAEANLKLQEKAQADQILFPTSRIFCNLSTNDLLQ